MQTFTFEGYRHMREHGASSYRPSLETAEQGAVRSALELARADFALHASGAFVEWERDYEADTSWMDAEQRAELERGETAMMGAALYNADGAYAAGLWSIHMRTPYGADPYRRVVEAELALEAGICHPLDRAIR